MTEEKRFEIKVKKYLESIGIYPAGFPEDRMSADPIGWYFKVWGGGFQKAGIPDIICCVSGYFVSIELKARKGKPTELQELNTDRVRKSRGEGVILYPSGFDEFTRKMKLFIKGADWNPVSVVFKRVYK